jgi:hypothetical protein
MQGFCASTLGIPHRNYSGTSNFLVRALRYFQNGFPTFIPSLFFYPFVVVKINTKFKGDHISQLELHRNKEMELQLRVAARTTLICLLRDCGKDCRDNWLLTRMRESRHTRSL